MKCTPLRASHHPAPAPLPPSPTSKHISPDHLLLKVGDLLGGELDAEIPPGHHDAVRELKNFIKVVNRLCNKEGAEHTQTADTTIH